jgi:hypothetical protein
MANEYFAQHQARLMAETWQRVQSSPTLRAFYEREERDRQRQIERQQRKQLVQRTANNPTVTLDQVSKAQ